MFFVLWKTSQTKHAENTCTHLSAEPKPPPPQKKSPSVLSLGNAGPEISESPPAVFSLAPRLRRRFRGCVIYVHADVCVSVCTCACLCVSSRAFPVPVFGPAGQRNLGRPASGDPLVGGAAGESGARCRREISGFCDDVPPPLRHPVPVPTRATVSEPRNEIPECGLGTKAALLLFQGS